MSKRVKILGIAAAGLVVLVAIGLLALPSIIDVNRYRGTIEAKAEEALGREVSLGEMKISVVPVFGVRIDDVTIGALPEEGGGDLLEAERLRVGARILPLLSRRLEVTSIVVDGPKLTVVRSKDGTWNVSRIVAKDAAGGKEPVKAPTDAADGVGKAAGSAPAFTVDSLTVRAGRVTIRDKAAGKKPIEVTLTGLDLSIDGLASNGLLDLSASSTFEDIPGARLQLSGSFGPLAPPPGTPMEIDGRVDVAGIEPARVLPLLEGLLKMPDGLVGDRPFSLSAEVNASLGQETRIALSDVALRDGDFTLRRDRRGNWSLPQAPGAKADSGVASGARDGDAFSLSNLRIENTKLRIVDASGGGEPLDVTFDPIDLSLDRLPTEGPAEIDLKASLVTDDGRGDLIVKGRAGPMAADGTSLPVDLEAKIGAIPQAVLRQAFGDAVALKGRGSGASVSARLKGTLPDAVEAMGTARIAGAEVRSTAPDGSARTLPLDLSAEYDVATSGGGDRIQIRDLKMTLGEARLALRGTLQSEGEFRRVDIEVQPSSVPAADLAALIAFASVDMPVSFASPKPIELQLRAKGLAGEGRAPDMTGTIRLREMTLRHASMSQPVEGLDADIAMRGSAADVTVRKGTIGSSDLAGTIALASLSPPEIRFDLNSQRADFGELFSFMQGEGGAAGGAPSGEGGSESAPVRASGRIRIGNGSFQTVDFTDLDATLTYDNGRLTIDPAGAKLYQGSFAGKITADLTQKKPAFTIEGAATEVDTKAFLTDNLDSPDLLAGRFTGSIQARGSGTAYEAIIKALTGSGAIKVRDGKVGKLDVLNRLSKVSGVFGEQTVKQLTGRAAAEGTPFRRLATDLKMDGGKIRFTNLVLEAADFTLTGKGDLGLLAGTIDGEFKLAMSPEVSRTMRQEGSKAARAFWVSRNQQVIIPFTLTGPFAAPTPGVDFGDALRAAAKDKVDEGIRGAIGDALGLELGGGREPKDRPKAKQKDAGAGSTGASDPGAGGGSTGSDAGSGTQGLTGTAQPSRTAPAPSGGGARVAATDSDLVAEVASFAWGSNPLAPDLEVKGSLSGSALKKAELVVADSGGRELARIDQLEEMKKFKDKRDDRGASTTLRWKASFDGKDLALARPPFTVTLIVSNLNGQSVRAAARAER